MNLKADSLSYWDEHTGRFVVEEEPIRIMVGGSSADHAAIYNGRDRPLGDSNVTPQTVLAAHTVLAHDDELDIGPSAVSPA